ncbi:GAF domain-containing protein [Kutzneria sp. CA-103260]|uniref:GAF domain-containing protein n=1 Tax=Kutzneria sp. CA-103260 TaxID=2802641 RepID=UPI001BA4F29E|nr:GAF domain-containing protein [Kutzneria sp. CA-103260]
MSTSQNLTEPLAHVTASYLDPAVWSRPRPAATSTPTADQLLGFADLALNGPRLVQSLNAATASPHERPPLAAVLPTLLEDALSLMAAEAGNIQLIDPADDSLVLVTQFGFGAEFVDHFAIVNDSGSVCGRAASCGAQVVVADVREDPACTPHQQVFRAAGVRAVQSTPLLDGGGRMIGMISTHRRQPTEPDERQLQFMGLYGHLAGAVVAHHLGSVPPGVSSGSGHGAVSREAALAQVLDDAVNGILQAGLSFAESTSLITDDHVARRVQAGIAALDDTIRAIRLTAYELGVL